MLPLGLLNAAQGHPMLVELKNGETLNGHLVQCDTWMNLTLKEVVQTSPEGDKFVRLPEVYIKGNNIKYLRVPDDIIDIAKEQQQGQQGGFRGGRGGSRGDHGGRGGERGGRGGRGQEQQFHPSETPTHFAPKNPANAMQRQRIVLDDLWRCLCPSIDVATLHKTLQRPVISQHQPVAVQRRNTSTESHTPQTPETSQVQYRRIWRPQPQHDRTKGPFRDWKSGSRLGPTLISSSNDSQDDHARYIYRRWKRRPELPLSFFGGQGSPDEALDTVRTDVIVEGLRELTDLERQYHGICNAVRYLVTRRNRKPDVFLYECLIKANADPKHGSAKVVGNLLEEMESKGILPTRAIFHSILDVLAIHPDYVLRNKTLEKMKALWNSPSFDAQVSITVGLLRDGQYELALDKLEELHKTGVPVSTWLYDIFIFTLGEVGAHEETLMILQHRLKHPTASIPHNVWHYLLDVFSRDAFYEGIKYIWNRVVMLGKLVPSDGVAINVLNTASRNDDASLAMQVIQKLSSRGVKLGMHHFEALLEMQARDDDVGKAFATICLMAKAGLKPDRSCTRAIFLLLQSSPERLEEAFVVLHDLKEKHKVPVAAFNVILEATLLGRKFKSGLDLYRNIHQFCSSGPDLETFSLLLQHCTLHKSMSFLLAEMEQLSIEPDEAIYDRIIFISTLNPKYEPAFRYLAKMESTKTDGQPNDWWISRRTALSLLSRSILAEDARSQKLIDQSQQKRGEEEKKKEKQLESEPMTAVAHTVVDSEYVQPTHQPAAEAASV
ncbi:hypothetical protein SCAR479_06697 [Seiridium cardinale]|uniref:Sm domain-containing protein n=1 Tax=Seiridium cardinale TaxID=138064 RepID=A0ABR2XS88_9PEZI